jgi:hypothetical protein
MQAALQLQLMTPSRGTESGSQDGTSGRYLLTYMDDRILIGRAQAGAGVFIFERIDDNDHEHA